MLDLGNMISFNKMDNSYQYGLPWVPWNKFSNMAPIKKNLQANLNKTDEFSMGSGKRRFICLPKLNVKKLCGSHLRQRSPAHYINKKPFDKIFSPVLRRGGTVDYFEKRN